MEYNINYNNNKKYATVSYSSAVSEWAWEAWKVQGITSHVTGCSTKKAKGARTGTERHNVGATIGKGWQKGTKRLRHRIWRSPPNPLGATHRRWWTLNAALLIEPWPSRRGFAVNQCGRRSDLISSDYKFLFLNHFFGTNIYF